MIQRYGQVSSTAGKIQRKYVKKAFPEGDWPFFKRFKLYDNLTFVLQTIIPTFWNTPLNLRAPSDIQFLSIR
jgi:hypothetical protein